MFKQLIQRNETQRAAKAPKVVKPQGRLQAPRELDARQLRQVVGGSPKSTW